MAKAIPRELKALPQWVLHCNKIPLQASGAAAKSDDSNTWCSYQTAVAAQLERKADGVGFVFSADDPFVGVDFDKCVDDGVIAEPVAKWVAQLGSYAEFSPSGRGVHVILKGDIERALKTADTAWGGHCEVYSSRRYFTVTGQHVDGTPTRIKQAQAALDQLVTAHAPAAATTNGGRSKLADLLKNPPSEGSRNNWLAEVCGHLAVREQYQDAYEEQALQQGRLVGLDDDESLKTARSIWAKELTKHKAPPPMQGGATADRLLVVVDAFQRWLYMPDPTALYAALGAVAANRLEGNPVWLLLVGPPASGKTEILQALTVLDDIYPTATITEAGLLSGSPKRETNKTSTGGLLRTIGDYGVLLSKDFGSVLSMHTETRLQVLAALREVYDGSWTRHVGADGGRTLTWEGKCGFVGGCTEAIDRHSAVMGAMGERFLMLRLKEADRLLQGQAAMRHFKNSSTMHDEISGAVRELFDHLSEPPDIDESDGERLLRLALLVTQSRSAVERDGYTREIELIPGPEGPARFAIALAHLLAGLRCIGCDDSSAWSVLESVALDSIPKLRRRVIEALMEVDGAVALGDLSDELGYPVRTLERTLEDLTVHGVVERAPDGPKRKRMWQKARFLSENWLKEQ